VSNETIGSVEVVSETWLWLIIGLVIGAVAAAFFTRQFQLKERKMGQSGSLTAISSDAINFLELFSNAGMVVDQAGRVVSATPSANEMGLVEFGKMAFAELNDLAAKVRRTASQITEDFVLDRGPNQQKLFVTARAVLLSDQNIMIAVEDRTELKRLEDTRRDFVANVSHELKTPISSIGLLSEAIQNATDEPEMLRKFAGNLQRESKRLGALVQDIIQLSKVQSADLNRRKEELDLAGLVIEAVELNQNLADSRGIRISLDAPDGILVHGDREVLITAVKNLIENAISYSPDASQVGIGVRALTDFAEVVVTDQGVGIPVEDQERIFERFYRVDSSRSRETGGTGLGLSLVKHAAISHGGEVLVFSRTGLGSTFSLRLPSSGHLSSARTSETE